MVVALFIFLVSSLSVSTECGKADSSRCLCLNQLSCKPSLRLYGIKHASPVMVPGTSRDDTHEQSDTELAMDCRRNSNQAPTARKSTKREGGLPSMRSENRQTAREGDTAFPWWHSGLRIQHCHCCGLGCCCGRRWIPGPRTSACHGCGKKKRERERERVTQSSLKHLLNGPAKNIAGCSYMSWIVFHIRGLGHRFVSLFLTPVHPWIVSKESVIGPEEWDRVFSDYISGTFSLMGIP